MINITDSSSDEDDPYTNSVARLRGNTFSICDSCDLIRKPGTGNTGIKGMYFNI